MKTLTANMLMLTLAVASLVGGAAAMFALATGFEAPSPSWSLAGEFILLLPLSTCMLWLALSLAYVLLRERHLPFDPAFTPSLAIVVPAHDEELLIADTIEALLSIDYPGLELHVVSDGSEDRTAAIARRFAARGVVVHELSENSGKSRALQHALDRIDADLFMVVDADTVPARDAARLMAQQFADPHVAAVTGSPRVACRRGLLPSLQAMEYAAVIGMIKRAESMWGGLFTVSGAAACFRTSALRAVGGWSSRSATEDIEVSWRLQRAGHRIAYEPRALFDIQAPATIPALLRQRRRWAQGLVEVLRVHGNVLTSKNPALPALLVQTVATGLWAALVLAGAIVSLALFASGGAGPIDSARFAAKPVMLGLWLLAAQTVFACLFEGHYRRGAARLMPLAALYPLYYWLIVFPSFVAGCARGLFSAESGR